MVSRGECEFVRRETGDGSTVRHCAAAPPFRPRLGAAARTTSRRALEKQCEESKEDRDA